MKLGQTLFSAALAAVLIVCGGCAKSNTSTPGAPSASAVQFVAYAEATVAAAETAVALIPGLSASDQALAQTALGDLGTGVTCVYNEAISTDTTVVKVGKITACLSSLTIPPQASPQLQTILKGAFSTIQAFVTAYEAESASQQAATVAAITPATTAAVAQRAAKLVK
jgi:hypothetical protein